MMGRCWNGVATIATTLVEQCWNDAGTMHERCSSSVPAASFPSHPSSSIVPTASFQHRFSFVPAYSLQHRTSIVPALLPASFQHPPASFQHYSSIVRASFQPASFQHRSSIVRAFFQHRASIGPALSAPCPVAVCNATAASRCQQCGQWSSHVITHTQPGACIHKELHMVFIALAQEPGSHPQQVRQRAPEDRATTCPIHWHGRTRSTQASGYRRQLPLPRRRAVMPRVPQYQGATRCTASAAAATAAAAPTCPIRSDSRV